MILFYMEAISMFTFVWEACQKRIAWFTGNYQDVVFISLGDRPELQDVVEPVKICLKQSRNCSGLSRSRA